MQAETTKMQKLLLIKVFCSLLGIGLAGAIKYDGLRVRFGTPETKEEYYIKLARTVEDVAAEGWCKAERPPGPLEELELYCSPGNYVCLLFALSGWVAGVQIAFPVDDLLTPLFNPEKWFTKWSLPASDDGPAKEYWAITQYLVSEESSAAGKGPQVENGATLQDGGVWVNDPDGQLMRIPSTEAEINATIFTKQNCVPGMGIHYYYNMTEDTLCENIFPWFVITTEESLAGVGFQIFGNITEPPTNKNWFEFYGIDVVKSTVAVGPECLYRAAETYPAFTFHIYYTNEPGNIKCRPGDSITPAD